jgi:hypothetical protein
MILAVPRVLDAQLLLLFVAALFAAASSFVVVRAALRAEPVPARATERKRP